MNSSSDVNWDPLEEANGSDQEIITAAKRREIKNILKSYVGTYDPMSELIQNAMDAVDRRCKNHDQNYKPKLYIIVNIKENSFQVIDNGHGFDRDQFKSFLAPNISFKNEKTSRGNKGVGATYIAYGFNDLEIRTKGDSFAFSGKFINGREWVEDSSGTIHRPRIQIVNGSDKEFDSVDRGTSIKIKFTGKNIRPSSLSWYQATTPEQWLYLLLVRTPLGHINLPSGDESNIKFDLKVIDSSGRESECRNVCARYKFPHDEINASTRLSDVTSAQFNAIQQSRDPSSVIEKYKNSNGIYEFYSCEDLKKLRQITDQDKALIEEYDASAYGYFSYSTSIWDTLNDAKAKLRKGYRIIKGGLQIANNHMAQGELITIPLTKSIGHQNQAHIIIHFQGADPDLGRKGFQPELKLLSERLSVAIVGQLSARRDVLKGDSGETPNIDKEIKVHDWLRMQEDHERGAPLSLNNPNFFLPTNKISMRSQPLSEQDVIVLFNQLLAGGVIRGIRLLSTSQVSQYDGVFRYVAEDPLENLVFDTEKNPLGIFEEELTNTYEGPPKILEYKYSLDGLIREFESGVKHQSNVTLAIFWDFGEEYKREYSVLSLIDFNNVRHRKHHGLTHIVKSANTSFAAICLKELMSLLNEPELEQENQKRKYGDEI